MSNSFGSEAAAVAYTPCYPPWYEASEDERTKLDNDEIDQEILNNIIQIGFDKLAAKFPDYQTRKDQIAMSKAILGNLILQRSSIVEAGTGIGKSFAYLLAALSYSYLAAERVLITTETKNLQMQLYEKDVPMLRDILDEKLPFELCLGSSNYVCKLRYDETVDQGKFQHTIEADELKVFQSWATEVFAGNFQGNVFEKPEEAKHGFWSLVNRDSDGCPAQRCEFFSMCNYYRVKNLWNQARLLIGNHHLLLFHLLNDKRTLPSYGAVIIDEAHGFIKTGFSIFTLSFSREAMGEQKKNFDRATGKLEVLPEEIEQEFAESWAQLIKNWDVFYSNWEVELDLNFAENETKVIEKPSVIEADNLLLHIETMSGHIANILEDEGDSAVMNTLKGVNKFYSRVRKFLSQFSKMNLDRFVYWGRKDNHGFFLNSCNLNLGEELEMLLTEPTIYTSATMGYWPFSNAPGSKSELLRRGYFKTFLQEALADESSAADMAKKVFFSPFKFAEQALLYVPAHMQLAPFNADTAVQKRYEQQLLGEITRLIELSEGGALVLFTSNYLMQMIEEELAEQIDYPIHSQLRLGATEALARFKEDKNSVLLGTTSFWQGVDVVGSGLRMLIITKLMFTPPDDPIFKARSTQLEKKNAKPFFELALPYASTMLRQAFGRLIRSETDKGVVAILDERVLTKSYGKVLLSNLPPVRVATKPEQLQSLMQKHKILTGSILEQDKDGQDSERSRPGQT